MNREDLEHLEHLTAAGESLMVEFKRSTGQLRRAGETLCGMLNTGGGRVLIGVTDDGAIAGQLVTDRTSGKWPGSGCDAGRVRAVGSKLSSATSALGVQTCFTTRNSERCF